MSMLSPIPAFLSPSIFPPTHILRSSPARRPRTTPICASRKFLTIQLPKLLSSSPEVISSFSEHVKIDRSASANSVFLLYVTPQPYQTCMEEVQSGGLVDADAVAVLNGAELYQKGYRTRDPYWAGLVGKGWEKKAAKWIIEKEFGDDMVYSGDEGDGLIFKGKGVGIEGKLSDMGIKAKTVESGEEQVWVGPAGGGVQEVVEFCMKMLNVEKDNGFLYGEEEWMKNVDGSKIVDKGEEKEGVYIVKGDDGIVEGLRHYAVF